ncbi:hypothetical protein E4U59_000762 [Claviceps monticola]|nr:hypothetical protein E4U59_000762 [Claviceps monticola]
MAESALTDNKSLFVKAVFENMAQKSDANWDRVATDLGLGPQECQLIAKYAKECLRQMSAMVGETRVVGGAANAVEEGG